MTEQRLRSNRCKMYLTGLGRRSWDVVRNELQGMQCAWADYEGFHVGRPCPTTAPPYTHLWAWTADHKRLIRIRIDGEEGIVGVLSANAEVGAQQVEVVINQGLPWGNDGQLGGKLPDEVAEGVFRLHELQLALPATFVAVGVPPDQGA